MVGLRNLSPSHWVRFRNDPEEVQALAQKAWRSVNKSFTLGDMAVKVERFGR
jgi:hypothetical protein